MIRAELIALIRDRLEGRQLVWFGIRGDDLEAVTEIPELAAAFSVINAYARRSSISSMAFEDLMGHRVDLDAHDIDDELGSEAMVEFRRAMLRTLARPSAVFTYRPSVLVSAVCFARRDRCRYLGMFKDHQAAFEHKPWVESSIAGLGVAHIPWAYVADEEQLETLRFLEEGPVMLRRSRSSGGTGLVRVDDRAALASAWPAEVEAYVSVAPFLSAGLPVNVGGVVWRDGITLHPASIQLIGVPGFTGRPFGYCGNDFAVMANLDPQVIDRIELATLQVGSWLQEHGYRGAFGVDYLVVDGNPLFTEVNPRFQGSTHASSQMAVEAGESCILLEHLAAHLGVSAPPSRTLRDWVSMSSPLSHFIVHWLGDRSIVDPGPLVGALLREASTTRIDVLSSCRVPLDDGATVLRATVRATVTQDGFDIVDPWAGIIRGWRTAQEQQATGATDDE